jgi:hypothetical protein
MSELLSAEYLNEIRDRCNAATSSPWISFIEGRDHTSGESVIARGVNSSEDDLYLIGATMADQDFIAHARQDIPKLLEEISRLRALLNLEI